LQSPPACTLTAETRWRGDRGTARRMTAVMGWAMTRLPAEPLRLDRLIGARRSI